MSQASTSVSSGKKPSVLVFLKLPVGFKAATLIKEGDKAQKISLQLLEETADSMEECLHDDLHMEHDRYVWSVPHLIVME